jgi:hypothetical protein
MAAAALKAARPPPLPREAPRPAGEGPRVPKPARASAWRPSPEGSPLANFADAAFAGGALLSTDGAHAIFAPAGLAPRPLEVPVPIRRVFGAGSRLFAQGENEGAPFLIALTAAGEAIVVPMPCSLSALAGEGDYLLGACAQGGELAESDDGGRTFRRAAFTPPPAPAPAGAEVQIAVEAVAVDADGTAAAVVARHWESAGQGERLRWSFAQVALRGRGERSFRFAPVPGLARGLAARLSGGLLTVAGAAFCAEGSLDSPAPQLRLFRGAAGQSPLPVGAPGPPCPLAGEAEGVLLESQIGAFRCGRAAVLTVDGGAQWLPQEGLGGALALKGGEMRLALRSEQGVLELRLPLRSASGAVAERVPGEGPGPADAEPPILPAAHIAEPARDGGGPL